MAKTEMKKVAPAKSPVPQSKEEASVALAKLGEKMAARMETEGKQNAALAEVTAKYAPEVQRLLAEEDALFEGLQSWAEANRADLCQGGDKTVQLGTGEVGWRLGQKKLSFKNAKLLIPLLKAKKLLAWIRSKEEIDKDAILKAQDDAKLAKLFKDPSKVAGIDGLKIDQEERFRAQPLSVDTEKMAG